MSPCGGECRDVSSGPRFSCLSQPASPGWGCLPVRSLRLPGLALCPLRPAYFSLVQFSDLFTALCVSKFHFPLPCPPRDCSSHPPRLCPPFPTICPPSPAGSAGAGGACSPLCTGKGRDVPLPDTAAPSGQPEREAVLTPRLLSGCVSTPSGPGFRRNTSPGRAAASASQPHQWNRSPRGQAHPNAHQGTGPQLTALPSPSGAAPSPAVVSSQGGGQLQGVGYISLPPVMDQHRSLR